MKRCRVKRNRRGSAAVAAVAVIVVVGLLCGALATLVRTGSSNVTDNIEHTQAYYAADAGVEWACKQNSATSGAVSFGGGSFQVTANSGAWLSVGTNDDAKRTILCQPQIADPPISNGLDYVMDSRESAVQSNLVYRITNNTSSAITFNKMKVTWTPDRVAYFQYLDVNVINGVSQRVWTKSNNSNKYGWGNGELRTFNTGSPVTIPAHYTAELTYTNFYKTPGGAGGLQPMNGHSFSIEFYSNNTLVGQMDIGLPLD